MASIYLQRYSSLKKLISLRSSSVITGSSFSTESMLFILKETFISSSAFKSKINPSTGLLLTPKGTFTICPTLTFSSISKGTLYVNGLSISIASLFNIISAYKFKIPPLYWFKYFLLYKEKRN